MKQNELIPFTFKDTGKTVLIRKVSPMLVFQLSQDFPPPAPPMVEVTYGEAEKVMEPNPADPAFAEALRDYHRDFNLKTQRMMIKRGVSLVFDDDMKAEVAEMREFYRNEFGKEIGVDDHMIYVTMICVGTDSDLEELLNAITRRSQPTEAAVDAAKDTFQS